MGGAAGVAGGPLASRQKGVLTKQAARYCPSPPLSARLPACYCRPCGLTGHVSAADVRWGVRHTAFLTGPK